MSVQDMKARLRADPEKVFVSVHRGLWGPLPENSLSAIRKAAAWEIVEVDVRLDGEGRPFLMHDRTLERTTGHMGDASGATPEILAEVRLKEADGGTEAASTDETVPRLEEAFDALDGTAAVFDLDVKRSQDITAVGAYVAAMGKQDLATLKIDVLTDDDLAQLKALEAAYDIMVMAKVPLRTEADLALVEALRAADVAALEVSFETLDILRHAAEIGGAEMRIGVYTLDGVHCCGLSDRAALQDPDAVWGAIVAAGAGQIMTDQPAAVTRYLSA